jgi:hypothetical protein
MENQEMQTERSDERPDWMNDAEWRKLEKTHRRGKIMGGLLIVAIGSLFLARELGAEIPVWMFSWKMLLIGIGIVAAIKHKFLHPAWIILVGIGGAFLVNDLYPEMHIRTILWPALVILVGLFIIFKPRRKFSHRMRKHWAKWHQHHHQNYHHRGPWHPHHKWNNPHFDYEQEEKTMTEDYLESTAFMAGVKKNILSKKFKGGEITNVFGGTELNLMQADIEDKAKLEVTQVFGGTKLIVPANWVIKSELVTVFGSVEDKRPLAMAQDGDQESRKTLILTGDTFCGGIEIRSY